MENVIVETAKVLPKGQITLPKDFREILGVKSGDRVVLISINGEVMMMNPAIYALRSIQKNMEGRAEAVGIKDDEDIIKLVRKIRSGGDDS